MDWINRAVIARAETLTERLLPVDSGAVAAAVHRAIERHGIDGRFLVVSQPAHGGTCVAQWERSGTRILFARPEGNNLVAVISVDEAAALYAGD